MLTRLRRVETRVRAPGMLHGVDHRMRRQAPFELAETKLFAGNAYALFGQEYFDQEYSCSAPIWRALEIIKLHRVSRPYPLDDTFLSQGRPDDGKMKLSHALSRIAASP
jgi:hypothetical protein